MKVVTARQPFTSLIAVGAKTLLDQARPTGYRGRLLIRAGSTMPRLPKWPRGAGARNPTIKREPSAADVYVHEHGICICGHDALTCLRHGLSSLPLGVVVASCELVDCVPIIEWLATAYHHAPLPNVGVSLSGDFAMLNRERGIGGKSVVSDQLPFGDFSPGRWVWLLDDVKPTTERCPRCWVPGVIRGVIRVGATETQCPTCEGAGVCPPVRMRGGPGLRTPEWEET